MYHHSESMVCMLEDMQHNADQMEAEVKMMLEMEGRAYGIELDRRKNARDLMDQLSAHINTQQTNDAAMTWAYVNEGQADYDTAMPDDYIPASTMPMLTEGTMPETDEDHHVEPENLP